MIARDSYHVVAIDFSPHTHAMQTDFKMPEIRSSDDFCFPCCFKSGQLNFGMFIACVCAIAIIGFALFSE